MAEAGEFDEGAPDGVDEMMLDEEAPEAIGTFVEIRHGEIGRDGAKVGGAASPDGSVGEEALINPGVAFFEFFGRHIFRAEDGVGRVVERPIAMEQAAFGFHLTKKRRGGIRSENVEGSAFETIGFDPVGGASEDVFVVVVEAEDEGAVHLNAVVVKQAYAAGVVGGFGSFFAGFGEILVGERFQADEDAGASGESHGANQRRIVGDVNGDGGAPDFLERTQREAKFAEISAIGAEIVVHEDGVGLAVGGEFFGDLLGFAHAVGHAKAFGREIAKAAAIVASAGGDDACGGEETGAREDGTARGGVQAIVAVVGGEVAGLQEAGFDIGENARPELNPVAEGERVGVRSAFIRARENVQAAEDDFCAAGAIPAGEFKGAFGEGEMDADAGDFGHGRKGRATVEKIFVPVADLPVRGSGGGEAGESESGSEDVLAEAGVGVFGIEGIDEQGVARSDRRSGRSVVEERRVSHFGRGPAVFQGPANERTWCSHAKYFTFQSTWCQV